MRNPEKLALNVLATACLATSAFHTGEALVANQSMKVADATGDYFRSEGSIAQLQDALSDRYKTERDIALRAAASDAILTVALYGIARDSRRRQNGARLRLLSARS